MKANKWLVRPIVLAVGGCFGAVPAWANPTGPQVMHGNVQMQGLGTNHLKVTNSPSSIIHWQGFSVGAGQITQFQQQSAASAVLNRVVGPDISSIHGQLISNGRVFLINPAGIIVGPGGVIDTAGFVGSTLNMLNADFLSGKLKFEGGAGAGSIVNQGVIRAGQNGNIILAAPNIENSGALQTEGGQLVLAAGQKVTIGDVRLEGVEFEIQAPGDSVVNVGKLLAEDGAVGVFAGTLKHSGDIRANALTRDKAGRVVLKGSNGVSVAGGSSISASGRRGGDILIQSEAGTARVAGTVTATGSERAGGDIKVLGDRVSIAENGRIDASGTSGGGQILVGGDYQGKNTALQNAARTFVGPDTLLRADATASGEGGRVIVWADDTTQFYGALSARGGPSSGNGGFAEVSGKENLVFAGRADLSAPQGRHGDLLLDPLDLFIATLGGSITSIIDEATDVPDNAVTVSPAALAAIPGNVILHAGRYMRFDDAIDLTTPGQSLTATVATWTPTQPAGALQGMNRMDIGADITTAGGAVSLSAPRIQTFAASTIATAGGAITLNTSGSTIDASNLTLDAGTGAVSAMSSSFVQLGNITGGSLNISIPSFISIRDVNTAGPVSLTSANSFISARDINSGGGNVTANASSFVSVDDVMTAGGGVFLTSTNSSVNTDTVTAGAGNVAMSGRTGVSAGTIDTTADVDLTATRGSIFATVNNAAAVNASASNQFNFVQVNITQTNAATPLNANSITATATNCFSSTNCPGANVNINATGPVNVGTVSASAPATNPSAPQQPGISETVNITSSQGSIVGMSGASQITAADVGLFTGLGTGGGIRGASPLNVNVERNFTMRANGAFEVNLNGTGPNRLNVEVGVAPAAQTYSGTLTRTGGGIALMANATDTAVTLSNITLSGFNQRVFGQDPSITLRVPNGALNIPTITVPEGDTSATSTASLPVTISSSGDLTLNSYTRQQTTAPSLPKSTTIQSNSGAVTLGTINAGKDFVSVTAAQDVTISDTSITSEGGVSVQSTLGDVTVGQITSGGNVTVTANAGSITVDEIDNTSGNGSVTLSANETTGSVVAETDSAVVEVLSDGTVAVTGQTIGTPGFTNPLDLIGSAVTLTSRNAGGRIGFTGGQPVMADAPNLTINAANPNVFTGNAGASFHVDTGNIPLQNLTVIANPAVNADNQVRSDGRTYAFTSDGTNFTFEPAPVPAAQFNPGLLSFTSTTGNIFLGDANLGTGSLAIAARVGSILGTPGGGPPDLDGAGLTLLAGTAAGGAAVQIQTGNIGANVRPANVVMTAGRTGFGSSRNGSVETGAIFNADNVNITTFNGMIKIGPNGDSDIASLATPAAGNVALIANDNNNGASQPVNVGSIFANTINLTSQRNTVDSGNLNAAASINLRSGSVSTVGTVTTGTLDSPSISISNFGCCVSGPNTTTTGAIGGVRPVQGLNINGSTVNIGGGITGDPSAADSINIFGAGPVTVGGAITAGAESTVTLNSNGALTLGPAGAAVITAGDGSRITLTNGSTPLEFSRIDAVDVDALGSRITITSAPGITQTTDAATVAESGISAETITLSATGGPITNNADPDSDLDLRSVVNLTLNIGGSTELDANGSTLANLSITKSGGIDPAPFALTNLGSNQSIIMADTGGGAGLTVDSPDTLLNFALTYNVPGEAVTLAGAGIVTSGGRVNIITNGAFDGSVGGITTGGPDGGGRVDLLSNGGDIITGAIDTTPTVVDPAITGGPITVSTNCASCDISVNGDLQTGPGGASITLRALSSGSISRTAGSEILSESPNSVIVSTANGNIGTDAAPMLITSPTVTLSASGAAGSGIGDVFATLTGTTNLNLTADDAFNVSSSATLGTVSVATRGSGTGTPAANTLNLTALDQTYTFARPATDFFGAPSADTFQVITANGGTPATNATFVASDGHLLVAGTANLAAPNLSLRTADAAGDLLLQGGAGADRLILANTTQNFTARRDLLITGNVDLESTGDQTLNAFRNLTAQAQGGTVDIDAAAQTIFTNTGAISFLGGGAANESVTVSANAQQTISTPRFGGLNRDIVLAAGAADGASVVVRNTGGGLQQIQAGGNVNLTGGAAPSTASIAEITTATAPQLIRAEENINLTGGDGTDATARIVNTGAGNQQVGEARFIRFCCDQPYQTDSITLQGGDGSGSFAEVIAAGPQQVFTRFGTVSLLGGAGMNAFARIQNTSANAQNIGDSDFDSATINMQAGAGQGAFSHINAAGLQIIRAFNLLTLGGGGALDSFARINTTGQQSVRPGSLEMIGGSATGTFTSIDTNGQQTVIAGDMTLIAGGDATTAVANAGATIQGRAQNMSADTVTLNGGAGTAGAGNASDAVVRNLSGAQNINVNLIVMSGGLHDSTTGILNDGAGTLVSASNGITMTGNATGANADVLIRNSAATLQTIRANNGGISLDNMGAGDVGITSAGTQNLSSLFLDVLTSAGSTGDSLVSATGNQYIRTTNGTTAPVASVRAAALGSGMASIDSTATQLLEIEYIEHMTGTVQPGSIFVGNTAAVGTSRIQADDQLIFARTMTVQGGSGTGSSSKVTGADTQAISTFDGGISVLGGSGASSVAAIDPVTQTIVSNGAVVITGGSAADATASIVASGAQSVIATKDDVTVQGGTGGNARARIETTGAQTVTAADELNVVAGGAAGATALIQTTANQIVTSTNAMTLTAGAFADLIARITTTGAQTINFGTLALNAGTAGGANARIDTAGVQTLTGGNVTLTGNGAGTMAQIDSTGDQTLTGANVALAAGNAANALARITTSGAQTLNFTSLALTAGSAAGANANVHADGAQTLNAGGGNVTLTADTGTALIDSATSQVLNAANVLTLTGGAGTNATAQMTTAGAQTLNFNSLVMNAGGGSGAAVKLDSEAAQTLNANNGNVSLTANAAGATALIEASGDQVLNAANALTLTGGAGANASAQMTAGGAQTLTFNSLAMNAGAGDSASVKLDSEAAQTLNANSGNVTLTANGPNATALIEATGAQALNAAGALTLNGAANANALARITTGGTQTLNFTALTMMAGAANGAFVKIDAGSTQTLNGGAGNITLTAMGTEGAPLSNAGATIEGHFQTLACGNACNLMLTGGAGTAAADGSRSDAGLDNLSGPQNVAAGMLTFMGGHQFSRTGIRNQGGTQNVTATNGPVAISLQTDPDAHVDASVGIENVPATAQTITAVGGETRLDSRGAGTVAVTSGGTQSIDTTALDVITTAGNNIQNGANATVSAVGEQTINASGVGAVSNASLRVASRSTGTAKVESGTNQTINPAAMQASPQGLLLIGALNADGSDPAVGDSLVRSATDPVASADQTIRVGSLFIQGPSGDNRISKIKADGTQVITTFAGGITLVGGSGTNAFAQIDPTQQTITSSGPITLQGGSGPNADALINATGPQTIISQNGPITLIGGSGQGADALIVTTSPDQTVHGQNGSAPVLQQGPASGGIAGLQQGEDLGGGLFAANTATSEVLREQDQFEEVLEQTESAKEEEEDERLRRRARQCS